VSHFIRPLHKHIFCLIEKAESIHELEDIQKHIPEEIKKNFPNEKYPRLKFALSTEEINQLKSKKILNADGSISHNCAIDMLNSPLEKLLYSVLWKNGHLGKEKHIADGILENRDHQFTEKKGLVFYYFGKHLKNKENPIIDQHVIRAFLFYEAIKNGEKNLNKILTKRTLDAKDEENCSKYIEWQNRHSLKKSDPVDFTYHLDRLLFAVGKALKKATII
jgi:hypothetical protein